MPTSLLSEVTEKTESQPEACTTSNGVTETKGVASPEGYPALEARVLTCLECSDFGQALSLLEAALMVRETAELWNDWGSVQFQASDLIKAESGYRRALAISPDCREAAVNLGFLLLKSGRGSEAQSILSKHRASLTEQEQQALASANPVQEQESNANLQLKIDRLEKAIEYLLLKQLNAQPSGPIGRSSYDALVNSFWNLIQAVQPKYFFDIGANDASTARRIKQLLPLCEVWAFEANPKIHAKFLPPAAAAGVRYVNLAVSSSTGQVTLYMPRTYTKALINGEVVNRPAAVEPEDTGRSSVLKRNEEATYEEFTVPSVTLDHLFEVRGLVDEKRDAVLWVDVEGAAFEVLSAAGSALKKAALLFVEAENHPFWTGQKDCADVARVLLEAGFIPLERDREYGDKQFNTLFVHQSLLHLVYPKTFLTKDPTTPLLLPQKSSPSLAKRFRAYRSIAAYMTASIPMIIPVFNNPSYTENMVQQLVDRGFDNICLIDNGSTSEAMLATLERAEKYATVIRSGHNHGPRHTILNTEHYNLLPEFFCVTDPDLEFQPQMPEDFVSELARITEHFKIGKAGLALRIDDAEKMHGNKFFIQGREYLVPEWEQQWWRNEVGRMPDGSRIYRAVTDTTFAVYNKKYFTPNSFFDSVRVAGTYTCRHLPWYRDSGLSVAEDRYYRATQKWSYHLSEPGKVSKAEFGL
jgi:FkbM family methyltransferase